MVKKILLLFFSVSVFFLLFASPLSYYSSSQSFYAKHMMQEDRALTGQSMEYVQNVYRFIR